jgi:pimeloyl-ACP methyl ester carboxylesterase
MSFIYKEIAMRKWIFLMTMVFVLTANGKTMPAFYGDLKKVSIKNYTISYYRFGQGKPLIMIPGHGDNMTTWHPELLKQLSKTRNIILFDFPGIGESTIKGPFPNRMAQLSDIAHSFIKTQKLNKPDILGFSMGGSTLLYLATQHGAEYGNLIAVGGKAGGKKTILPEPKYFKMLSEPNISPEKAVKVLLFPPTAQAQADSFLKALSVLPQEKMNAKALKAQGEAVTHENNGPGIWDKLPAIKNNVLILNGTEDVLTPVENAKMIADAIPGAWLVRIKGAGHGVLFQKPDFCSKLIDLFLSY